MIIYRGVGWSRGIWVAFPDKGLGAGGEEFFGPLDNTYEIKNVTHGGSVGLAVPAYGAFAYLTGGYYWEYWRYDATGKPVDLGNQATAEQAWSALVTAFKHDVWENPNSILYGISRYYR